MRLSSGRKFYLQTIAPYFKAFWVSKNLINVRLKTEEPGQGTGSHVHCCSCYPPPPSPAPTCLILLIYTEHACFGYVLWQTTPETQQHALIVSARANRCFTGRSTAALVLSPPVLRLMGRDGVDGGCMDVPKHQQSRSDGSLLLPVHSFLQATHPDSWVMILLAVWCSSCWGNLICVDPQSLLFPWPADDMIV